MSSPPASLLLAFFLAFFSPEAFKEIYIAWKVDAEVSCASDMKRSPLRDG